MGLIRNESFSSSSCFWCHCLGKICFLNLNQHSLLSFKQLCSPVFDMFEKKFDLFAKSGWLDIRNTSWFITLRPWPCRPKGLWLRKNESDLYDSDLTISQLRWNFFPSSRPVEKFEFKIRQKMAFLTYWQNSRDGTFRIQFWEL